MSESVRSDYRELKERINGVFTDYSGLLDAAYTDEDFKKSPELKVKIEKERAALTARRTQLDTQEFVLVIIGEMKHGKSTFLNAMLGKPVFPKDVREATAAVTFLRHNDTVQEAHPEWVNKAVVEFHERETMVVDHLDLGKYTTCLYKGEVNVAEDVKSVTIYTDSPFVRDGVTVVDTPGTNSPNLLHEQITYDQIDRSHAAVFLFKAGEPGKKSDYEFLAQTAKKIDRFFFVVNRIDEVGGLAEAPKVIEHIKEKVRDNATLSVLLDKMQFYPTSGLQALLSRYGQFFPNEKFPTEEDWRVLCDPLSKREGLLKASGMDTFEDALLKFLFQGERTREFLRQHVLYVESEVGEILNHVGEQKEVLSKGMDIHELEQKQALLQSEYEREKAKLESASSELTAKLSKTMKDFVKDSEAQAKNRIIEFAERVAGVSDYDTLRQQWDEMAGDVDQTARRFAMQMQSDLKDVVQGVFRSADYKVRGELNKRLGAAKAFEMPDVPAPVLEYVVPKAVAEEAEKKLKQIQAEMSEVEEKLKAHAGSQVELEEARQRMASLEAERRDELANVQSQMQMLGTRPGVEQRMISPEHDEKEWHGGLLGWAWTLIAGRKTVHYAAEFEEDDSAQKSYDKAKEKLVAQEAAMRDQLKKRMKELEGKLSEAQRKETERVANERILEARRVKELELKRELREQKAKSEEQALAQMQTKLKNAMRTQLTAVLDQIKAMTARCSDWADNYIGGVQTELNAAMTDRKAELDSLSQMMNLKKKDREERLARLSGAEKSGQEILSGIALLVVDIDKGGL